MVIRFKARSAALLSMFKNPLLGVPVERLTDSGGGDCFVHPAAPDDDCLLLLQPSFELLQDPGTEAAASGEDD